MTFDDDVFFIFIFLLNGITVVFLAMSKQADCERESPGLARAAIVVQ